MLKLYNVNESYINYLRTFEPKILSNKNESRPYVGVVCTVNLVDYFVPLASPKEKYAKMNNSKDFHKIAGGRYGAINFNKMIPVLNTELIEIDIEAHPDIKYRNLLRNQFVELLSIKDVIIRKSKGIYDLFVSTDTLSAFDEKVKERCCNFTLLEEKMKEYK